jgi:hypothetical protein
MKNTKKWLGIIALVAVIGLLVTGCPTDDNGGGGGNKAQPTIRYETVRLNSPSFRTAGYSEPYMLAYSAKDSTTWYYLYYLGYIKSVPIAYKTAYRYDGTTPITVAYEKTWATEDAITESMTKSKESTWEVNASATISVGMEAGFDAPGAKVKINTNVSATIGGSYGQTVSTSNTYETAHTKINGETESISATIGDHGEAAGMYRYALFGVTDVYCLFKVNPSTRAVTETEIVNCGREASYAWGIDFEPDEMGTFGKTGAGDLFSIPNVNFSTIDEPTDQVTEPPPPPPPPERIIEELVGRGQEYIGGATNTNGDKEIDSGNNKTTSWVFRINSVNLGNYRSTGTYAGTYATAVVNMTYIVKERDGTGSNTVLEMTREYTHDLSEKKVFEVVDQFPQTVQGSLTGQLRGWKDIYYTTSGVIQDIDGILDDSGNDDNKIAFRIWTIMIRFREFS